MKIKKLLLIIWLIISLYMLAFFVAESITFANAGYIKIINNTEVLVLPLYYWQERSIIFVYAIINAIISFLMFRRKV